MSRKCGIETINYVMFSTHIFINIYRHKPNIPARSINVKNCKPQFWISILSMFLVNFIVIWLLCYYYYIFTVLCLCRLRFSTLLSSTPSHKSSFGKKNEWFCRAEAISSLFSCSLLFLLIFYECHTIFVHFHHFLMIPHLFLTFKVSPRWLPNIRFKVLVAEEIS